MKLFLTRKTPKTENLSTLFDQNTFYPAFKIDLLSAKSEVIIESPFISIARTKSLLRIIRSLSNRGVKVLINTRDPVEYDENQAASARLMIAKLQDAGALILF